MAILFSDTFESGTLGLWNTSANNGGITETATGSADVGTYGCHLTVPGGNLGAAWIYVFQTTPVTNYISFTTRVRFNTVGFGGTMEFFGYYSANGANDNCSLYCVSGVWKLGVYCKNASFAYTDLSVSIVTGRWYTMDIIIDRRGADPIYTLNVDGSQAATYTDASVGTDFVISEFFLQMSENAITAVGDVSYDNVLVTDTPLIRCDAGNIKF